MFSLGNLEGLCGVGLHISTVSDAGQGYGCPKAWLAGCPNCLPYCWVAAGSLATCFLMAPLACGLSVVGLLRADVPGVLVGKLMPFPASSQRSHSVVASASQACPPPGEGTGQRVRHGRGAAGHMYVQQSRGLVCPHNKHRCV